MPRLPIPNQDDGTWGGILNDYLSVEHNADGSLKIRTDGTLSGGGSVADADTTTKGILKLAGDLSGTADSPTVPGLAAKAADSTVVHLAGTETITGDKNFSGALTKGGQAVVLANDSRLTDSRDLKTPTADISLNSHKLTNVSDPASAQDAATKSYVDSHTTPTPDADATTKGKLQLAGDLSGTAASPVVADGAITNAKIADTTITAAKLSSTVNTYLADAQTAVQSVNGKTGQTISLGASDVSATPTTRLITTGTGLTGGGDLTADRTLSVVADSVVQKHEIAKAGTLVATRKRVNFIEGSNVSMTVADDSANNKVDVTIAATTSNTTSIHFPMIEGFGHSRLTSYGSQEGQEAMSRLARAVGGRMVNVAAAGAIAGYPYYGNGTPGDGGWGNTMYEIPRQEKLTAPDMPRSALVVFDYGINDLSNAGPDMVTGGMVGTIHAMRAMISRARCSRVFEDTDASVTYGANWANLAVPNLGSGGGIHYATTSPGDISIAVPADFPGGTIVLAPGSNAAGGGAVYTITVDGTAKGSLDTRNTSFVRYGGTRAANGVSGEACIRLTGLSAGAHTINLALSSFVSLVEFDWWGIEAPTPPLVLVLSQTRSPVYTGFGGAYYNAAVGMSDSDVLAVNIGLQNLVAEFDSDVVYVDTDTAINANPTYFYTDLVHYNELGQEVVAKVLLNALRAHPRSDDQMLLPAMTNRKPWITSFLQNSWVAGTGVTGTGSPKALRFFKDYTTGMVRIEGAVKNGSSATATITQLGMGYQPAGDILIPIVSYNGTTWAQGVARLTAADGKITPVTGASTTYTEIPPFSYPVDK